MRITVERETLVDALAFVSKHADDGKFVPVLGHVLIQASAEKLTLSTTNTQQSARATVAAEVEDIGAVTVPCALLLKAVRNSNSAEVSMETDGQRVIVRAGKSRYTLPCLSESDFPGLPSLSGEGAVSFVLPAGILPRLAKEVGFAADTSDHRHNLRGVSWRYSNAALEFWAGNGKIFSCLTVPPPVGANQLQPIIVPDFALPDWEDPVLVTASATFVRFQIEGRAVASALIEEDQPEWDRVPLMLRDQQAFVFDRVELISSINRMAHVASEKGDHSILFVGRDEELSLSAVSRDKEVVDSIRYQGGDFLAAITHANASKALASLDSEMVELRWNNHENAVCFAAPGDTSRIAVSMPYRDWRLREYLPQEAA